MTPSVDVLNSLSFAGATLSPLFLQDPRTGSAGALFEALSLLNADEATAEWPLADKTEAQEGLDLIVAGLKASRATEADGAFCAEDKLVEEYRRLFIGPAQKPAPPWGSVYTDREQVIFGESTLRLRSWMRQHGIARLADDRMPDDHIGLMLSPLATLTEERPELVEEYLSEHLLPWAPHYLGLLEVCAEHPFYKGLALLTKATLKGAQDELSLVVIEPRFYR